MRALMTLVIFMGLLIFVGTGVLVTTIVRRSVNPPALASAVWDEPAGTRIAGAAALGQRLAVVLQGGGPDRIVLVDPQTGRRVEALRLAH